MKKVVFIVSHLNSGSLELIKILNYHPRLKIYNTQAVYEYPLDIEFLFANSEFDHAGYYYGDHILHNIAFLCKTLYKFCKFIYVIRPAKPTLNLIINNGFYGKKIARDYYCMRIRRMYEMAKKTPEAVVLTWNDLTTGKALTLIQDYLELKQPIKYENLFVQEETDVFLPSEIEEAEAYYEKYLYKLKQLDLRISP